MNGCLLSESGESWGPSVFESTPDDEVVACLQTSFLFLATESAVLSLDLSARMLAAASSTFQPCASSACLAWR